MLYVMYTLQIVAQLSSEHRFQVSNSKALQELIDQLGILSGSLGDLRQPAEALSNSSIWHVDVIWVNKWKMSSKVFVLQEDNLYWKLILWLVAAGKNKTQNGGLHE